MEAKNKPSSWKDGIIDVTASYQQQQQKKGRGSL
jgi:hypothetical protein